MQDTVPQQKRRLFLWTILFVLCVLLSGSVGYLVGSRAANGQTAGTAKEQNAEKPISLDAIERVWKALQKSYINQPVDQQKAVYGAIQGMVESLDDPYTVFFTPDESKSFREEIGGVFEGIGAEIGMKNDQLMVIAPLPGSPAEKAGLKAGDKIVQIDDASTQGVNLDEAVKKIRGAKGTNVTLVLSRDGETDPIKLTITRESITVQSVQLAMSDDSIGTIKLSYFGPETEKEFSSAIDTFLRKGGKGIILDMRNNPGGFLDTAVAIVSKFVEKNTVVVKEHYSDKDETVHKATGGNALQGFPTIVLVDQGSASASEIVAGALQDYRIATIVGVQTFGKGSVQQLEEFADGSSLKVTIAKWLTPKDRSISDHGITPDVKVELTKNDYDNNKDPQLERAMQLIREKINQ